MGGYKEETDHDILLSPVSVAADFYEQGKRSFCQCHADVLWGIFRLLLENK